MTIEDVRKENISDFVFFVFEDIKIDIDGSNISKVSKLMYEKYIQNIDLHRSLAQIGEENDCKDPKAFFDNVEIIWEIYKPTSEVYAHYLLITNDDGSVVEITVFDETLYHPSVRNSPEIRKTSIANFWHFAYMCGARLKWSKYATSIIMAKIDSYYENY